MTVMTYRLTRVQAERLWVREHKLQNQRIIPSLPQKVTPTGGEFLLSTGAKLSHIAGGGSKPYLISGTMYVSKEVLTGLV